MKQKGYREMKTKQTLAASAALLLAVPLVAESVNGFENFTLSRNDYKSNPSSAFADFSSRTRTVDGTVLASFSSRKPCGTILTIR